MILQNHNSNLKKGKAMKRSTLSFWAVMLVTVMLLSAFSSCTGDMGSETDTGESSDTTLIESYDKETKPGTEATDKPEDSAQTDATSESESSTSSEPSETDQVTEGETVAPPSLEGEYANIISVSNKYKNGVNTYYSDATRTEFVISNQNMSLSYTLAADDDKLISSIKTPQGASYLENTMDVFVRMQNGKTFYSSSSMSSAYINIDRFGYYYYQTTISGQGFISEIDVYDELDLNLGLPTRAINMSTPTFKDGVVSAQVTNTRDPQIQYAEITPFDTSKYNYLAVTVRVDSVSVPENVGGTLFIVAGSHSTFNNAQSTSMKMIADGEFHTYYLRLDNLPEYTGKVTKLRFDLDGNVGDCFEIKDVKAVSGSCDAPQLAMRRTFNTYSDKNLQVIQVSAISNTNGIDSIGMITDIPVDRIEKLIVKDKNGMHTDISDVDWQSAEYVGFDIKNVGIFGYILLSHATSGDLSVELTNGSYRIIQSRTPDGNSLSIPNASTLNANDFYMGHRIYTDTQHDFSAFVNEAECERNPLPAENIIVNGSTNDKGAYIGYNVLRGAYEFTLEDSGFNSAYFSESNKHFGISFTVKGDDKNRTIYMMAAVESGELECAAVLDKNSELLPIPIEVIKNFTDGDYSIHSIIDNTWSESFFPSPVGKSSETSLTLLHLYQNWGRYPLKQLSSIKFGCPYYHLSTGVTETNCIVPWFTTGGCRNIMSMLPDHRSMSAPFWGNQPQHTSGGSHGFLEYTDEDGNYAAAECIKNTITSYGPTYAEVIMDYLSDDGKVKATYTHMEMPQTDENRGYYTITYEFIEDISFNSFKEDFSIYAMTPKSSVDYKYVGYLNDKNECKIALSNTKDRNKFYVLGDQCPYFSYFRDDNCTATDGYVNLSFLIYNSEIVIGGQKVSPNFAILDRGEKIKLTLDLDKAEFKAGDKISLNAIIMPWGSQETDYESEDRAPDQNVREVRENSLLNPLKISSTNDCYVVDQAFLPRVRTTNGKSAEFTVSGGNNNCTVRLDGFTELTIPTVYELIDGKWERYNLSSFYYPDKTNNNNNYDGYGVTYEDDGFFSYSFIVEMDNGAERTFKFIADKSQFTPEVEPPKTEVEEDKSGIVEGTNKYFDADAVFTAAKNGRGAGNIVLMNEDELEFVRLYGNASSPEAFFSIYQRVNDTSSVKTGQFFIIKYRVPADKPESDYFAFFSSTNESFAKAEHSVSYTSVKADGEWHVLVLNLAEAKSDHFSPAPNGTYDAQYLRFDVFNRTTATTSYTDIAFMAFDDSFTDVISLVAGAHEKIEYYNGSEFEIKTEDGTIPESNPEETQTEAPEESTPEESEISVYLTPQMLDKNGVNMNTRVLSDDGSYITYKSHATAQESYFFAYNNTSSIETGQYLVFKYRSTVKNWFEFFASTTGGLASTSLTIDKGTYVNDGEWHVIVINLAQAIPSFAAKEDGKYYIKQLRFDVFNTVIGNEDETVDVAYLALCTNFNSAIGFEKTLETVQYYNGTQVYSFSVKNSDKITEPNPDGDNSTNGSGSAPSEDESAGEEFCYYWNAKDLAEMAGGSGMGERKLSADGKYVTYYSNESAPESYFMLVNNRDKSRETGQYLVLKYKTSIPPSQNYLDFFVTTEEKASGFIGSAHFSLSNKNGLYFNDDVWRVLVIDLSAVIPDYFSAESDGSYHASYLRFDIFNSKMGSTEFTLDVAYVGLCNSYEAAINHDKTQDPVLFYNGTVKNVSADS